MIVIVDVNKGAPRNLIVTKLMRFLHELLGWAWIINFIFGRSFDLCTVQFYCVRAAFEKLSTQRPQYSLWKRQVQDPRFRTVDEAPFTHLQLFQCTK